ncbi:adenylate/guanylate cyclase domain-containing protein [Gramella sp. MAR_2010_147]|uniref:adenylate/guanylate cyclase domain-containing protein n=1 Tax=Gramella sp. MAR_2010_147 TaxID=1250205 RepID=UPI00087B6249|nr:adenylate/guanylate cyclase domain-containing protein [Gramella sp. MAR_2010_147]SDS22591.1 Adenylate cyclase, class 3 [Gramella sp. MAR_2010_147]
MINTSGSHTCTFNNWINLVLFCLNILLPIASYSQDQTRADSIEKIYNSSNKAKQDLKVLKGLAENTIAPYMKLKFSKELLKHAKKQDSSSYLYSGYLQKGNALASRGDFSDALESYFKAASVAKNEKELGLIKVTLGDVYSLTKNHDRSINYYNEAIEIFRRTKDSLTLGSVIFNAGDGYLKNNEIDKAISYLEEAEVIFENINFSLGLAYCSGTLGLAFAKLGRNEEAEKNIKQAIQTLEKEEDYSPICEFLNGMSDIYTEKDQDSTAIEFASLSRELAKMYGFKNEVREANLKLAQLYEKTGNMSEAYYFYKEYIVYKDSVLNVSTAQNMAGLRADYEVAQKQAEVDLLSEQRKNQQLVVISIAIASFLICLLAFGLYRRNRFIKRTSAIIEKEKNRSELLLLNILPEETARELKKNGKVRAKKFESVTVLFADFKRFTLVAEKLTPERLIKTIDYYFSKFDKIMEKYDIEKIKTIGDSYMAASGLPFPNPDHASRILMAAFEMIQFVKETKENSLYDDADFDVRIGLNSGPVVAGVVGTKKFAYDIWGDTVNIAARMESHSDIGRINISENTYELIKRKFDCEYRGEVEVKNGRILKMYYVHHAREKENKIAG